MTGLLYVFLSIARLGFLSKLLSRPIISSFLTAGALLISLSQVSHKLIWPPACSPLQMTECLSRLAAIEGRTSLDNLKALQIRLILAQ